MRKGILIARKLAESDLWLAERFTKGQAWIDLIMLAHQKARRRLKRGILITLYRGQVYHSAEDLAKRWRWSTGKVRRFLDNLTVEELITRDPIEDCPSLGHSIRIINYDQYETYTPIEGATNDMMDCSYKSEITNVPGLVIDLKNTLMDDILSRQN